MELTTQTIPAGYKQTDIGMVPADWDIKRIEGLTPHGKKYGIVDGPFGSNLKTEHYRKSGIPIITSGYVTDGHFSADEYLYVDKEKFKQEKRSAVKGGDIVMAKIGARCGASAILPKNHAEGILSGNALKISIDENRFSTFFVWQILWDLYSRGDLESIRSTGAQPALSMASLKKYQIAIPTVKAEQEDIATALSDADELIDKLKLLIAKKRNIKRGAMQELLTGKRRLHGFSGDWEYCSFVNIWLKTYPKSQVSSGNGNPLGDFILFVSGEENKKIDIATHKNTTALIFSDGGFFNVRYFRGDFSVTDHCVVLTLNQDNIFYYHWLTLNSKNLDSQTFKGSGLRNLDKKELARVEVPKPSLQEQSAIACVLSDMDTVIEKLETQLIKYQNLKQGMMQVLLTGKIRLPSH